MILFIAIAVIPARSWPAVFKFAAKCVRAVRQIIWKINDATESVKDRIEREMPIDELSKQTFDDVSAAFRTKKVKGKR